VPLGKPASLHSQTRYRRIHTSLGCCWTCASIHRHFPAVPKVQLESWFSFPVGLVVGFSLALALALALVLVPVLFEARRTRVWHTGLYLGRWGDYGKDFARVRRLYGMCVRHGNT
jgi:hypothetical protein